MEKIIITYHHLKKLLTSQPYFVFNSINEPNDIFLKEEDEENTFWHISFDELNDLENNLKNIKYIEIIKNGYDICQNLLYQQIEKQFKNKNLSYIFINEKNKINSFKKTLNSLNDKNIDIIIKPCFIVENVENNFNFDVSLICQPLYYDKKNKKLSSVLFKSKTVLKDYIQAFFEYNVLKKLNIEVEEYSFYLISENDLNNLSHYYYKAKDVSFNETFFASITKSKTKNNKINENDETIIEKIKSKEISENKSFDCFDNYIDKIIKAKTIKEIPNCVNENDYTIFGENSFFNALIPEWIPHVSGLLINKKEILELINNNTSLTNLKNEKTTLKLLLNKENKINLNDKNLRSFNNIKNKKILWYDFEGFMLPFTILPFTKPYQQIVFQVSIIITNKMEIIKKPLNIVLDPKKIDINMLINIIDQIYCEKEKIDYYVVFNKSYENGKLNEIEKLIKNTFNYSNNKCGINKETINRIEKEINFIKENTIDLLDYFKITSSKTDIPPIFLYKLNGYSSIKKIEKYINNEKLNLEVMITPYSKLEVQNGLMAMNCAIQRFLGVFGDNEWNEKTKELAAYCENDVKAMIMVFYLIKKLINENIDN